MNHNAAPIKPWYKQPWLWFVISFPAVSVVAGITTVIIATINADSTVKDGWYKDGLAIKSDSKLVKQAKNMGISAEIHYDKLTGELFVNLSQPEPQSSYTTIMISLLHPTLKEQDIILDLKEVGLGRFRGDINTQLQGNRHVMIQPDDKSWQLNFDHSF